jgi:hypothetical protein
VKKAKVRVSRKANKRGTPAAAALPAPKTSWTEAETRAIVEATRRAVLEKRRKKKAEAAAAQQTAAVS